MRKTTRLFLIAGLLCVTNISRVSNENFQAAAESDYVLGAVETVSGNESLSTKAKAAYVMDYDTQTPIYLQNESKRLPIASMCKIMTLILCFDSIHDGQIAFDEEVCVSESAASMGGSQVFLEANAKYPVKELIKSIVVCSANDSCVAMAERIAGSESLFVDKMNEKAKELGATNTLFANCTGLPKEPQYSCAKDVAILLKELLKNEEYFQFGSVWMDKFQHPKGRYTEISNTNKLVRFYDGCDGGKTGFTNEAGFCLAATAKRNDMRIISVVIGEESSAKRFEDVKMLFDYAFANCSITPLVEADKPLNETVEVASGKTKSLLIYAERNANAFMKRGEKNNYTTEMHLNVLKAPIEKGSVVGELLLFKDGIEYDRVNILAGESIEKANFFDCLREVAGEWNAH